MPKNILEYKKKYNYIAGLASNPTGIKSGQLMRGDAEDTR